MRSLFQKENIKLLVCALLCILLGTAVILQTQVVISLKDYEDSSASFFENLTDSLSSRSEFLEEINGYSEAVSETLTYKLYYLYSAIESDNLTEEEKTAKFQEFGDIVYRSGADELYVTDTEGRILSSCRYETFLSDERYFISDYRCMSGNIIEDGILTEEQFRTLSEKAFTDPAFGIRFEKDGIPVNCRCIATSEDYKVTGYFITLYDMSLNRTLISNLGILNEYFDTVSDYSMLRAFAIDKKTGMIIYTSDNISEYLGTDAAAHGIDITKSISDGKERMLLDGRMQRVRMREFSYPEIGDVIFAAIPGRIGHEMLISVIITALIFAAVVLLVFVMSIELGGCGRRNMLRKLAAVSAAGTILVGLASFYARTLSDISQAMGQGFRNAAVYEKNAKENSELSKKLEKHYEDETISILEAVRTCFERNMDLIFDYAEDRYTYTYFTRKSDGERVSVRDSYGNPVRSVANSYIMENMVSADGDLSAYLINHDGLTIATNTANWYYGLLSDLDYTEAVPDSDRMTEVLERRSPYYYSRKQTGEVNEIEEIVGIPVELCTSSDGNGNTIYHSCLYEPSGDETIRKEYGLLILITVEKDSFFINEDITSYTTLESIKASENTSLFVVADDEEHTVLSRTDDMKNRFVQDMNLTEDDLDGDDFKFIRLNNNRYFASIIKLAEKDGRSLLTLFRKEDVFFGRMEACAASSLITALILFAVSFLFIKKEPEKETVTRIRLRNTVRFAKLLTGLLAVLLAVLATIAKSSGNEKTAFAYAVSEGWSKGVHVFSLSYVGYLLLIICASVYGLKKLLRIVEPSLNSQMETIARLFISIAEYAAILVIIFYSMFLFGVQTGTVITSAGIMTIVVGLGANSLIGDIVAGLFIIIEREYKVDDIVTIDNYTGVVKEIGLRTTKILDSNGNLKTLNNSKINGVLNLTDNYSKTFITVSFNRCFSVEEVEAFIDVDLKKSLENNRKIIEGPWFSGITDMKGENYTVSIGLRCRQQDQWSVRKDVYRSLIKLSKEKEIKIS